MNKKISDKDKKDWEDFVNSKDRVYDKEQKYIKKNTDNIERTIDLHGYTLENANKEIQDFILKCFEDGVKKINIITGKGTRSKNLNDPFQSKNLSILKYSIPHYIKNNEDLMNKIIKINFDAIESHSKGSFDIILKNKNG